MILELLSELAETIRQTAIAASTDSPESGAFHTGILEMSTKNIYEKHRRAEESAPNCRRRRAATPVRQRV